MEEDGGEEDCDGGDGDVNDNEVDNMLAEVFGGKEVDSVAEGEEGCENDEGDTESAVEDEAIDEVVDEDDSRTGMEDVDDADVSIKLDAEDDSEEMKDVVKDGYVRDDLGVVESNPEDEVVGEMVEDSVVLELEEVATVEDGTDDVELDELCVLLDEVGTV
jgi:hypothetical protein